MQVSAVLAACLLAAASLPAAEAVVWVKGGGGSSCTAVCAARGGCNEEAFPQSAEEFNAILEATMLTCETIQEGGAQYDPSTDGHHCGWSSGDDKSGKCEAAGDQGTYRFCPCATDKEL
mmetsp:Transcript_22955/g.64082  ORF Transcript_22955/g.64082 Transcript_22955/m.64082 type:complete len:119 (-) Transcript_22955:156-512(-)